MAVGYDYLQSGWQLLYDLQMGEGYGVVLNDSAKPHHQSLCHGAMAWMQLGNDLNWLSFVFANPDFIDSPDTADLRFTSGAFTLGMWMYCNAGGNRCLMVKGVPDTDGWYWYLGANWALNLITSQAAASQTTTTPNAAVTINTWQFIAAVRSGASVVQYVNGQASVGTAGTHVDPVAAARELHLGINDAEVAGWWSGGMWRPRIWGRALTATEVKAIYERERTLFGV